MAEWRPPKAGGYQSEGAGSSPSFAPSGPGGTSSGVSREHYDLQMQAYADELVDAEVERDRLRVENAALREQLDKAHRQVDQLVTLAIGTGRFYEAQDIAARPAAASPVTDKADNDG